MGDACGVESVGCLPQLVDDRRVAAVVVEVIPKCADGPQHQQCVVARRHARGHHRLGPHSGLRGEQRDEALVRDLGASPEPDRRTRLAVPDRPPQRREELGVVGIASVHLHDERFPVSVLRLHEEETCLLTVGRAERARRHPAVPVRPRRPPGSGCLRTIRRSDARRLPRSWRSAHRRSLRSASSPGGWLPRERQGRRATQ